MHYKNGTEAELGDIARGKGYNLPYEVQGVVVGLSLGTGVVRHPRRHAPSSPAPRDGDRQVPLDLRGARDMCGVRARVPGSQAPAA